MTTWNVISPNNESMLFNRLDKLYQSLENPMQHAGDCPASLKILEDINSELQSLLDDIRQAHGHYAESLSTRRAMQHWLAPDREAPSAAIAMYLNDQFDFYREIVADMMAAFTGSERNRCVSFALSVDELLFMIRLLLEEQLMETQALKPIFLFLSRYARTIGTASLSYESLRKKYSRTNPAARQHVGRILAKLASRAEQYEGKRP